MNAPQPDQPDDHMSDHVPPEFGALDIVEAFTALRHEYRNQTKESRAVAEGLQTTSAKLDDFAARIEASMDAIQNDSSAGRSRTGHSPLDGNQSSKFALRLAEIDLAVSRSIEAASRSLANSLGTGEARVPVSAADRLGTLGPIARFFCRRFAEQLDQQWQHDAESNTEKQQTTIANVISGLAMTTHHVRRQLEKQGVERIDVIGKPFDGEFMRAVEVVESATVPPGHVVEQISPAYRFDERILLYADVRIAQS